MIQLKRVLAATDFSEFGSLAIQYGEELANAFQAELRLLHVVEAPLAAYSEFGLGYIGVNDIEGQLVARARESLQELPAAERSQKLSITREVIVGLPYHQIVNYAKSAAIDLIVVGTHGRGAIAHMLMGSTAERIVRYAPCPVLTVRQGQHQFVMP